MTVENNTLELLAPAGNTEKLEIAIHYGADAVYLADKSYSLRNFSGNFSLDEIQWAVNYAHRHAVKVYVAVNIYPRNHELSGIQRYLKALGDICPDGLIIADPGILSLAGQVAPHIPIHLSTQANTTNLASVRFWERIGIRRINTARELPLAEIKEIAENSDIEIEAFVHGAMCISYSGRCLLSSYLIQRDANRGMCAHPCRWKYAVVEEFRPGEYLPLREDARGSYIFNSRDLCMIEHLPEMMAAGIRSFKIEGRMKGINYLASTLKVYREALDACLADQEGYHVAPEWIDELANVNYRGYCTGFYLDDPSAIIASFEKNRPMDERRFVGKVLRAREEGGYLIEVRNKITTGDQVEVITPRGPLQKDTILKMQNEHQDEVLLAQPGNIVSILTHGRYEKNDLIRKREAGYKPAPMKEIAL